MVLVEAVLGGLALALLFSRLADSTNTNTSASALAPTVAVLTFVTLLFVVGRTIVGLASNLDGLQVWQHVVGSGPFWIHVASLRPRVVGDGVHVLAVVREHADFGHGAAGRRPFS